MIRVLLVDDQELVRAGLRGILRRRFGFEVIGECAEGSSVVSAVKSLQPDIVLMDVRMPVVDGVEATRRLRREEGAPPILALTTFDDDEVLAAILRAGAAGFVLKGVPAEDLQRAVRVVADGGAWLDPAVTGRVLAIYRSSASVVVGRDAGLEELTGREREVLALIGRGHTNGEIADRLGIGEGTVKTHVNHLFSKLQLRDRAAAVVFAFDHDLVAPLSEEPLGAPVEAASRRPGAFPAPRRSGGSGGRALAMTRGRVWPTARTSEPRLDEVPMLFTPSQSRPGFAPHRKRVVRLSDGPASSRSHRCPRTAEVRGSNPRRSTSLAQQAARGGRSLSRGLAASRRPGQAGVGCRTLRRPTSGECPWERELAETACRPPS